MKIWKSYLFRLMVSAIVLTAAIFVIPEAKAQEAETSTAVSDTTSNPIDSIEISLLTCGPFDKIYALYGHTGIRIHNLRGGDDIVANWGVFDMTQSFFPVKFAFGITDYRMAFEPFEEFRTRYQYFGTYMTEQVLNLSTNEKMRILAAIQENSKEENIFYRYNFFFDNCTTRARDILLGGIEGEVQYTNEYQPISFRDAIHTWTNGHQWMEWGQDFLLGIGADRDMTRSEAQFLPWNLVSDFDHAVIVSNGQQRPLVSETRQPLTIERPQSQSSPMTSPDAVVCYAAVLFILLVIYEKVKKKYLWQLDAFTLLFCGSIGVILFCMIFSQHPTVSLNFQILVFNPLALVLFWPIIKKLRQGKESGLLIIIMLCLAAAFVASFFQEFSAGTRNLAFLLLVNIYLRSSNETIKNRNIEKK